ncbi:hypothetical protein [Rhodocista pekingensis]|uniref:LemA family protein n=1 Tax=Rhodocista pekingensis TaxID=201185 RepID=A0ABW2KZ94_9PROT
MTYGNAILVGSLLGVAGWLFAFFLGKLIEVSIDGRDDLKAAQERIPRLAQMEIRFELRRAEVQAGIARVTTEVAGLRRQRYLLERELAEAHREAEAPIRIVGRESAANLRFRAWVVNRQVQASQMEGKPHPTLDAEWATPQVVEVWAETLTEARREIQRLYPLPLGFAILNMRLERPDEGGDPDGAAAGTPEDDLRNAVA